MGVRACWTPPLPQLLCLDPAAWCIACAVTLASRDAWLEAYLPFKASCHQLDSGNLLSDVPKIYAEMPADTYSAPEAGDPWSVPLSPENASGFGILILC